ncbi:MAG: CPBP family intramembrane metalloprotease [Prevotella sp.]|nr:CPBP family intramembrane metalloprotease [Prevotella sp.]
MKVIYNKYFPFGKFLATNICGLIFCRSDKGRLSKRDENHEYIHTLQQREMLYVGFMLWYCVEWLCRAVKERSFMRAYFKLYFEREAYGNERNLNYRHERRPFGWWHQFVGEGTLLHEVGCFIGEIADFIRRDFRLAKYLYVAALALLIIVGQLRFHVYDWLIEPSYDNGTSMLRLPMVYMTAYFLTLLPTLWMHGELWRMRKWQSWLLPALLVSIDGAGQGFHAYYRWAEDHAVWFKDMYYMRLVGSFMFRSVFIVLSLCVFRWLTDGRFGLYGLTRSAKYLRVYGLIYVVLLPLFLAVSFTPQFLSYYPKMDIEFYDSAMGWSNWQVVGLFELCYANDFLGVESMFRGALVIGLTRWLGPRAVLPMAITYMCIHLGKPDLELCSSVIGGYTLGILAYRTRHLWGGIIIHLGIAMFFEAIGILRLIA